MLVILIGGYVVLLNFNKEQVEISSTASKLCGLENGKFFVVEISEVDSLNFSLLKGSKFTI